MADIRVYELAKEQKVTSKDVLAAAKTSGIEVSNHMSTLNDSQVADIKKAMKGEKTKKTAPAKKAPAAKKEKASDKALATQLKKGKVHHNFIKKKQKGGRGARFTGHATGYVKPKPKPAAKPAVDKAKIPSAEKSAKKPVGKAKVTAEKAKVTAKPKEKKPTVTPAAKKPVNRPAKKPVDQAVVNKPAAKHTPHNNAAPAAKPAAGKKPAASSTSLNKKKKQQKKQQKKRNKKNRRFSNRFNMYSKNQRIRQMHKKKQQPTRKARPLPKVLEYQEGMNAQDLGKLLHKEPAEIVKKLFLLGIMVNQNQSLDKDTIELLAADYNIEAKEKEQVNVSDIDKTFEEEMHNTEHQEARPPVVTIMGHVDHGKTTLLDYLRNSHITSGEAGGITQAIGAYQLKHDGKLITFLDTPGHAAFTEMRARGANITDITVLVVAADDGVMPQTVEAIDHAKAAKTPIIVAVNKIDKPDANPQHVKEQLMGYGLIPEDNGGDTIFVDISAKTGKNVEELLKMILLQAEVMELKANPEQNGAGSVVEARLDKGKGPVATLLVQQGTLHTGDPIVVGDTFGRVRTMTNENGQEIKAATPSTPVEITGLNDVPEAGDRFLVFNSEKMARSAGEQRAKEAQVEERKQTNRVTLDNLFDSMKQEDLKQVNIVIKADVQGSVEALADSLKKIDIDGVAVNVIHASVGAVNESDVSLAKASNAIIIGFNVRPTPQAKIQAETDKVDIRLYQVIYNAIDDVKDAMTGMLDPEYEEEVTGNVDVRQIYKASKVGTIAGGMVKDGYIDADSKVRLIRDGVVKYDGQINSLKRFKDDVKTVKQGFECGLTIENYNDIKVGDVIEAYHMKEVPAKARKSTSKAKDALKAKVKVQAMNSKKAGR